MTVEPNSALSFALFRHTVLDLVESDARTDQPESSPQRALALLRLLEYSRLVRLGVAATYFPDQPAAAWLTRVAPLQEKASAVEVASLNGRFNMLWQSLIALDAGRMPAAPGAENAFLAVLLDSEDLWRDHSIVRFLRELYFADARQWQQMLPKRVTMREILDPDLSWLFDGAPRWLAIHRQTDRELWPLALGDETTSVDTVLRASLSTPDPSHWGSVAALAVHWWRHGPLNDEQGGRINDIVRTLADGARLVTQAAGEAAGTIRVLETFSVEGDPSYIEADFF